MNRIELAGRLNQRKVLRFTPAGVPVSEGVLEHSSEQIEAGALRQVECEIQVIALGDAARWLQAVPLGGAVKLTGFLAAKSRHSKTPVLHVNSIEFLEGNENGSILQEEG
ncbi:MAG TPA: primosomal replication protein N [Burkholderiaceae bacterium]|nr:primosomal replication protein N [Burkholderiaceae bacterium]